ncbi:hypothetical protein B0H16DRAFT_1767202 [Mycena metata]|uniref:Uncharacterized protein n=1 Tax=Mycena metata TaxID=1033252 RepID=A0AAD7MVZ6_9AGAR|nr:hypothetical protein B0H16DRAFT_1767202 [Mycena metata]
MEAFLKKKWSKLRQEILKHYDAERALQKYKPADVKDYALKMRNKGCYNLTQWRKYFVRYNSIAGGPLTRGHLSMEDYFAFFQIDEDQYTIKEWNRAAEWYFRRNKYETLMISAGELGEDLDEGDSGDESDDESFSSSGDESNYEEYRRKRKLRAKKKHQEKKNKTSNKKSLDEREKNKYQGNEEEIAGMIRKLNAMRLDDPEYAPIYYKVMVMDRSGTTEKCIKPPYVGRSAGPRTSGYGPSANSGSLDRGGGPASFPNNIPLGNPSAAGGSEFRGCYGCLENGHRIFECKQVADLVQKNIIVFNPETRKLVMKNGDIIRWQTGESLVKAAARIAGENGPRVMFSTMKASQERAEAASLFYQRAERQARIVEVYSESPIEEESEEESEAESGRSIYLTMPVRAGEEQAPVYAADRTTPGIRKARKASFDGVYPPTREQAGLRPWVVRDLQQGEGKENDVPATASTPASVPNSAELPVDSSRTGASKRKGTIETLPELIPVEARRVRFEVPEDEDIEMREIRKSGKSGKKAAEDNGHEKNKEAAPEKPSPGRRSELAATVNKQEVMDRILDTVSFAYRVERLDREASLPNLSREISEAKAENGNRREMRRRLWEPSQQDPGSQMISEGPRPTKWTDARQEIKEALCRIWLLFLGIIIGSGDLQVRVSQGWKDYITRRKKVNEGRRTRLTMSSLAHALSPVPSRALPARLPLWATQK